jgi:hypothetical protein
MRYRTLPARLAALRTALERVVAGALLGLALALGASAEPLRSESEGAAPPASPDPGGSLAAADAAGWIVYPDRRPGPARDYSPSTITLKRVLEPQNPDTPALDWLDLWGPVQSNLAR